MNWTWRMVAFEAGVLFALLGLLALPWVFLGCAGVDPSAIGEAIERELPAEKPDDYA